MLSLFQRVYGQILRQKDGYCLQPDKISDENTSFRYYASKDYTQVQLLSHGGTDVYEPKLTYNRYDGLYYEFASNKPFNNQLKQITVRPARLFHNCDNYGSRYVEGRQGRSRPADLKIDGTTWNPQRLILTSISLFYEIQQYHDI